MCVLRTLKFMFHIEQQPFFCFSLSSSPTRTSIRGPFNPGSNISSPNTASTQAASSAQPLHKWPLKPGVQVHVNSLTSLADDSKPLFNTNSTTVSSGSYQIHQNDINAVQLPPSLLSVPPSSHSSLVLQRTFPSSTLDYKRSSSSSSTASSSSNLITSKLCSSALHTLPRNQQQQPLPAESTTSKKSKWSHHPKNPFDHKHFTNKLKQRPKSVISEFHFNGNSGM